MRTVRDIPKLLNIPVLVRCALNVPVENGRVTNDYRLRRALPTIEFLAGKGARVVLMSHIGEAGTETLTPVYEALKKLTSRVSFFPETIGVGARDAVRKMMPGTILMLENLRRNRGEVMNDPDFAKELATLADVFVEDSFDTCHRSHASIVSVPKLLPSYAGLQLEEEIRELSQALVPTHPSIAIIGGAKFSTKEAVLTTLLEHYTNVFVGGALANDFLKVAGFPVGKSLVGEGDDFAIKTLLKNPKLILPLDSLVIPAHAFDMQNARSQARVATTSDVQPDEIILDHGPETSALLARYVQKTKTLLWNGPLGNYEQEFVDATNACATAIANSNSYSIIGGGDTIAAIEGLGLLSKFSFVSTGGGAMLDFLAKGTLPGISALQ
jgi:phosphoglycerate kinase